MDRSPVLYAIDDDAKFLAAMTFMAKSLSLEARTFECAESFFESYEPGSHGCALVDLNMPDLNGIGVQARLTELDPDLPFIMITGYADIPSAVEVSSQGAFGFLEKPFIHGDLVAMIRRAMDHSAELEPVRKARLALTMLTPRERDVFDFVVQGYSNSKAGKQLAIGIRTVETHRAALMRKLEVASVIDLVTLKDLLSLGDAT
jgi:FixJ family two-component response regulator